MTPVNMAVIVTKGENRLKMLYASTRHGRSRKLSNRMSCTVGAALDVFVLLVTMIVALSGSARIMYAAETNTFDRKVIENVVRDYLLANPEVVRDALEELEKRDQKQRTDALAAVLKASGDELFRSNGDIVLGNPDGNITLVEFFDFNCGYCKRALSDVQELIDGDSQLRVVLKDFPILGPGSVEAAKVALALKPMSDPSQLAEFHKRLLETQGQVNGSRALKIAQEMGFDIGKLQMDSNDPMVQAAIDRNLALAQKLGLTGTPSFIVGSNVVVGAVGVPALQDAIKAARDCDGAASC